MADLDVAIVILGMAVVTVVTRSLLLVTGRYWAPSNSSLSSLRYAPAAALAALIAPDLMQAVTAAVGESSFADPGRVKLAAVATSVLVFLLTRRSGPTLVAGVAIYLLGSG